VAAQVFLDTSAVVALALPRDECHEAATTEFDRLRSSRTDLVTSTDVIDEAVTYLRRKAGHRAAVRLGGELLSGAPARTISVDDSLRVAAWEIFRRYREVPLSLTDCTSVAIMRRFGMTEVFSFDSDFEKLRLIRLPVSTGRRR
jgi:uncharacterized protein